MLRSFVLVSLLVVMLRCVWVQSVLGSVLEVPRELLAKDASVAEEVKALWVVGTAPPPAVAVAEGLWGCLAECLVELWVWRGVVGWFWLVVGWLGLVVDCHLLTVDWCWFVVDWCGFMVEWFWFVVGWCGLEVCRGAGGVVNNLQR